MSVYRHASSRSVGIGNASKARHAPSRFSVSQPGSSLNEERAFTASSLILLLFRTSGTTFALMYHLSSFRKRGELSKRARPTEPCSSICSFDSLTDRAFHLQLDQAVQLDCVLQRKLLGNWLDEAVDDHRDGLLLGEPAAHEVEELVLPDLRDRCLVLGVDLLLLDLDVRICVRPRVLVQQERVALDPALGVVATFVHFQEPAIRASARPLGDGLGGDQARGVRSGVDDLAARVLMLPVAGVGDGEDLTPRAFAYEVYR